MGQCCCLAFWGLPGTCPISSRFPHFLSVPGTLLAVALVVIPRVGGFAYVLSLCRSFKWTLLRNQQFLPPPQLPPIFTAINYEVLSSWSWIPRLRGLASGRDRCLPSSQGIPPNFFPPHTNVGPPILLPQLPPLHITLHALCSDSLSSPPLLPIPLDEYGFFKSLAIGLPCSFIFCQFWVFYFIFIFLRLVVILLVVVRGGEACPPKPPSWL